MSLLKRELPMVILFISGIATIIAYYFTWELPRTISGTIQVWVTILAAFALGLGVINTIKGHIISIQQKREGRWMYSVWFIVLYVAYVLLGLGYTIENPTYNWIFTNVLIVLYMAMVASTGFFITSAAYRAFRIRTLESALLLIPGMLVLILNMPLATALVSWSGVPGNWIYKVPLTAGLRGINIGAAIGIISLGVRNLLGYERTLVGIDAGGEGESG